ncbi:unnamed protein product [Dibothriocephalus latus]|uniref:Uncharacterized protein n=1 Tax=Dibothriocephalus latus TaxID=60516 RepID=A0A3P7L5E9_DIBLA|nr:unnamed protein product [Dibothriocephalus latus]
MGGSPLDKQLVIYKKLDCEQHACQEFPAIVEEQLHILSKPITIYEREIEQIKIYSNGFIALGNHSTLVPKQYPAGTVETGQRLGSLGGDFIGVFTTVNHCSTGGRISIRYDLYLLICKKCVFFSNLYTMELA